MATDESGRRCSGKTSAINTISAAVQDCWGLTNPEDEHFSLHALGKRKIKEGFNWLLHRDHETYDWWFTDEQNQQLPTEAERLGARVLKRVQQHGYQSTNELAKTLKCNAEHLRLVCFDLFEQGRLQRHPRRTGKRGRPEYLYGVGDFSHVTHTPFLTTVPYIGGEDDPAWGPRPEVI